MPDEPLNLQFDHAEYAGGDPENKPCTVCQKDIAGQYFASGEAVYCASCAAGEQQRSAKPSRTDYFRGLAWGLGAAAIGSSIYFLAWQIGFGRILGAIL